MTTVAVTLAAEEADGQHLSPSTIVVTPKQTDERLMQLAWTLVAGNNHNHNHNYRGALDRGVHNSRLPLDRLTLTLTLIIRL